MDLVATCDLNKQCYLWLFYDSERFGINNFSIMACVYFTLYEGKYQESLHGQNDIHHTSSRGAVPTHANATQNLNDLYACLINFTKR